MVVEHWIVEVLVGIKIFVDVVDFRDEADLTLLVGVAVSVEAFPERLMASQSNI